MLFIYCIVLKVLKALKQTKNCQRQTFQKQTGKKCLSFSCQIEVWVLLETKCIVGYKMAAFRFEGPYLSVVIVVNEVR